MSLENREIEELTSRASLSLLGNSSRASEKSYLAAPKSLAQLALQFKRRNDRVFLETPDGRLTYGALYDLIALLSLSLRELGVTRGANVGFGAFAPGGSRFICNRTCWRNGCFLRPSSFSEAPALGEELCDLIIRSNGTSLFGIYAFSMSRRSTFRIYWKMGLGNKNGFFFEEMEGDGPVMISFTSGTTLRPQGDSFIKHQHVHWPV